MIETTFDHADAPFDSAIWLVAGLAAAFLAFAAAGCGETAGCGSDQDCKGDRVCSNNSCVAPDDSGGDDSSSGGSSSDESSSGGSSSDDSSASGDGTDGGGSSSSTSTEIAYCCLNGAYYECPDSDAVEACTLDNGSGRCTRDASRDGECDTSTGGGSSGDTSGGSGGEIGDECQRDSECATDICIFRTGAEYGYCSRQCDSSIDCPSFWSCEMLADTSATYCVDE